MPLHQPDGGRQGVRLAGGHVEPAVPAARLAAAARQLGVETLRPLLPVGYTETADAYRRAAASLTAADLTNHYTDGQSWLDGVFVPTLKERLAALTGGAWDLSEYVAWAGGSDVDLMTHLIEAAAARREVALFPGDWYGFLVGGTHDERMVWRTDPDGRDAAICVPSVRNGHFTEEMARFVDRSGTCLLNINLFPTLPAAERRAVAERLAGSLSKCVISISFSRGFALTAAQLGVALVHRDHPWVKARARQQAWLSYFYSSLAARAFVALDPARLRAVDDARRAWVAETLAQHGLPMVSTGSYYVRSFRPEGPVPDELAPLLRRDPGRGDVVRFCMKPPQVG